MDISPEIASRLKEERKRLKLTKASIVRKLEIARSSQIRYENGTRALSADYLVGLHELGFNVTYILFGQRSSTDKHRANDLDSETSNNEKDDISHCIPDGNFPWSGIDACKMAEIVFRDPKATDRERALSETLLAILNDD